VNIYIQTLNAFLEDTCVLVVIAYLLARGRLLVTLFEVRLSGRNTVTLGIVLGLIGLTEALFPGARYPYVTNTLIIAFAGFTSGLSVALIAAGVMVLGAAVFQSPVIVTETLCSVVISALVGSLAGRLVRDRHHPFFGLLTGLFAQMSAVLLRFGVDRLLHGDYSLSHALISVPANGFGVMVLLVVLKDARVRADSERHRAEAERAHALASEAQLRALRARIHPHFLFNALTSISALCGLTPTSAQDALLRLSQLMRRALETHPEAPQSLEVELRFVESYLEIEQHRFGPRLNIRWEIDAACRDVMLPTFALQTLVENAVNHGLASKIGAGTIRIVARRRARRVLLAVVDDGVGMNERTVQALRITEGCYDHGLQILDQQLRLLHGAAARLRIFSRPDQGTLVAFAVPQNAITYRGGRP